MGHRSAAEGRSRVAIGLGANVGDRVANLTAGVRELTEILQDVRVSRLFETRPRYVEDQPNFLNAALVGWTRRRPRQLLADLQDIERRLGRRREGERFGPRVLDLDLLLYDEEVIRSADLSVPHPRLTERAFVLIPLSDVASDWRLPAGVDEGGRTVGELASEVSRTGICEIDVSLRGSVT